MCPAWARQRDSNIRSQKIALRCGPLSVIGRFPVRRVQAGGQGVMPGMNSGVNANDPTVIAAFKAALTHQGIIALLIFGLLGLAWVAIRARQPVAAQDPGHPGPARTPTGAATEP